MLEVLMLTACLKANECKPARSISYAITAEECRPREAAAKANLLRHGRIYSTAKCVPYVPTAIAKR